MIKSKQFYIRKTHRYLGLFLGIQFLFWTASGLYFSWTNIDDIHGDQFRDFTVQPASFNNLISPSKLEDSTAVKTVELRDINGTAYYWINKQALYNAQTGTKKNGITKEEALAIATRNMRKDLVVKDISFIETIGKQHEYREKLLPAYVITYQHSKEVKAYVSANDGTFQTVRHRDWRWFDFLWMTHTMDYDGRDNINNWALRIFSLLGLITTLSGFLLWFVSTKRIKRIFKGSND
ncbi:MAG: hypothetical protein RL555_734 [Bacteroidota bacterium]|jgi:uncharacterized iron-regulated membrane protein